MFIAWLWFSPNNLISVCTDYWKIHKVSHVFFTNIECLWSQSSLCIFGYLNWWKKKCSLKEKGAKLRLQLNYQYVYCVHMPLLSTLSFAMSLRHFFIKLEVKNLMLFDLAHNYIKYGSIFQCLYLLPCLQRFRSVWPLRPMLWFRDAGGSLWPRQLLSEHTNPHSRENLGKWIQLQLVKVCEGAGMEHSA